MVNVKAALRHRGKRTIAAKRYARKVIVRANAADDHLCILGGVPR